MKLPISWLKDFVDLEGISVIEIAHKLTMAGMEVEDIRFAGLPLPEGCAGERGPSPAGQTMVSPLTPTAYERRSTPMICSTGRPGTT